MIDGFMQKIINRIKQNILWHNSDTTALKFSLFFHPKYCLKCPSLHHNTDEIQNKHMQQCSQLDRVMTKVAFQVNEVKGCFKYSYI